MEKISEAYSLLWKVIIRPPRDIYSLSRFGQPEFFIDDQRFERHDLQIVNERGHRLECSHFLPVLEPRNGQCSRFPCVIYLHGNCSSRVEACDVLPYLLTKRISVFCLDLSGSGQSEGEYISLGHHEQHDLKSAIDHLRACEQTSAIALWGRSMGAVTSALRAAEDPNLAACVLDSPFSSLPQVAQELVNRGSIPVPRFLVGLALQVVRREVQSRADFDIEELVPVRKVPHAVSPALFATAVDDDFILPHHTEDLHKAWGGEERVFMTFDGGHGGQRPSWFYETAATFLEKQLASFSPASTRVPRAVDATRDCEVPTSADAPPELSTPNAMELLAMGFSEDAVVQALKRHSSVEAALTWILELSTEAIAPLLQLRLEAPSSTRGHLDAFPGLDSSSPTEGGEAAEKGRREHRGRVTESTTSEAVVPHSLAQATTRPLGTDGLARTLVSMGIKSSSATEAARRCSSVEAAMQWLEARELL
eukprot:TRINITY_DN69805_c0_g1_i1.p1 TRINITY_DN69805_c0_g1~~TRINITY_DN69805_c0_g1_i1.p1  ORF type:complete len:479 (-),score=55.32 TRINITY_DN69805_c0_g1_i1:66-1502(-)